MSGNFLRSGLGHQVARFAMMHKWLVLLLLMCSTTLSAQTARKKYISELAISSSKDDMKALTAPLADGWTIIHADLNKGAGGDFIYLCYKTSDNANDAITDLVIRLWDDWAYNGNKSFDYQGRQYYEPKLYDENPNDAGDLNQRAGGTDIFLYYSKDQSKKQLQLLTDLKVHYFDSQQTNDNYVKFYNRNQCVDWNLNAGGSYVYVEMVRDHYLDGANVPELTDAFHVYDLGGGYYQFDVPMMANSKGTDYIVNSAEIQYLPTGQDNWSSAVSLVNKNTTTNYSLPIELQINLSSGLLRNADDFQELKNQTTISQDHGNHKDQKFVSFYWKAPDNVTVAQFGMFAKDGLQTQANFSNFTVKRAPERMTAPEGENIIALTDPGIFASVTGDNNIVVTPGTQQMMVQSSGKIHYLCLWDATAGKFLAEEKIEDANQNCIPIFLPPYNCEHEMCLLLYCDETVEGKDYERVTLTRSYSLPFKVKPFHDIAAFRVFRDGKINDNGVFECANVVQWEVSNVRGEDAMADDLFLIQRAYKADFSDAETIGSVSVGTQSGEDLKIDQTTGTGIFTFEDTNENSLYNAYSKELSAGIYYRVLRAVVNSIWGEGAMGNFCKSGILVNDNYLASVQRISVEKQPAFETNKTVKVRVTLGGDQPMNASKGYSSYATALQDSGLYRIYCPTVGKFFSSDICPLVNSDYYRSPLVVATKKVDGKETGKPTWRFAQYGTLAEDSLETVLVSKGTQDYPFFWYRRGQKEEPGFYVNDQNNNKYTFENKQGNSNVGISPDDNESLNYSSGYQFQFIPHQPEFFIWSPTARIVIQRYSPDDEHYQGKDYAEKTITVSGEKVMYDKNTGEYYVEVEDVLSAPEIHYYYRASVDDSDCPYPMQKNEVVCSTEQEANDCFLKALVPFKMFSASLGTLRGRVAVEWEADEAIVDEYRLERRAYQDEKDPDYHVLVESTTSNSYIDMDVLPGKVYEYRVTAICHMYGKELTDSAETYGWNSYYGQISGSLHMSNGALMPGKVKIQVVSVDERDEPDIVSIEEVRDSKDNKVIVSSFNSKVDPVFDVTDGKFKFENLPFSNSTRYLVKILDSGLKYTRKGQEEEASTIFVVTLDKDNYEPNLELTCNSSTTISGRVLYAGSTVPVRDCEFLMNDNTVRGADGRPVTTDSKGEFSFEVPAIPMELKVFKEGHVFENGGKVLGRTEDLSDKNDPTGKFTPHDNYPELRLYDNTTVRLVGRMIGGNEQGCLPLGFGKTHNNLGENLRLVLELEGDNTSLIVYDPQHPDNTTRQEEFLQEVYKLNSEGGKTYSTKVDTTQVSFEKKRIVIYPDRNTGEFCIDLFPAKYKVTELSAKGYASLFNEGEGFQVLDLSNQTAVQTIQLEDYAAAGVSGPVQTDYHATYQCVHHNPVTVSLQQYEYGLPRNYFGAKTMQELDQYGNILNYTPFTEVKKGNSTNVSYVFDYPVFAENKAYQIEISAHEDYYFNGDHTRQPEKVYIEEGDVLVRNGLVSSESETKLKLDKNGKAMVNFVAGNTTFHEQGENALRSLSVQVCSNGYYYNSDPLQAFVTGSRQKGNDVLTLDGDITLLDIVRDPYGSKSSAYRESGSVYEWNTSVDFSVKSELNLKIQTGHEGTYSTGVWAGTGAGTLALNQNHTSDSQEISNTIPLLSLGGKMSGEYSMTLNTRVQTSDDPKDVGANADVYIGAVNTVDVSRRETFSIIHDSIYQLVKPGIDSGAIRVVKEGKDAKGDSYYLVISEKVGLQLGKPRQFIYTQKHITNVLIPNLIQRCHSLVYDCDEQRAQHIADSLHQTIYYMNPDGEGSFDLVGVSPSKGEVKALEAIDNPLTLWGMAQKWGAIIAHNEEQKLKALNYTPSNRYSLTASAKIEHTEAASWNYKGLAFTTNILGVGLVNGDVKSINAALTLIEGDAKQFGGAQTQSKKELTNLLDKNKNNQEVAQTKVDFSVFGAKLSLTIHPSLGVEANFTNNALSYHYNAGTGYTLETNDNSYLDIDVYRIKPDSIEHGNETTLMQNNAKAEPGKQTGTNEISEYVYVVKGGAERQPWYEPDSTLFHQIGTPLGCRTLKIDNPVIYIDKPVVSNLPANEKAYFQIRLTNASEITVNADNFNPSKFSLYLDDKSTPDGAAITMDGKAIGEGREFYLNPGESVTKTIQVERQGLAYDYENMRLSFTDEALSLETSATFSVHFLPSSTPLKMVKPANQWILNTLSPFDQDGYYMPVEVNGFDVNYENFDHIEIQYKKQTEGDYRWVNLCSFFSDTPEGKELYEKASGKKEFIHNGTISLNFYGEVDPMEMNYDLRAVSFCRLGNKYVTQSSEVMSGTKDTRIPEVFGMPKPSSGILTYQDVISVPFSEPIAYNYLDKTANFQVLGYTANSKNEYKAALAFSNETYDQDENLSFENVPISKVHRYLTNSDFTVSGVFQIEQGGPDAALIMHISDKSLWQNNDRPGNMLNFAYMQGKFIAKIDDVYFVSAPFKDSNVANTVSNCMTAVAMTFITPDKVNTAQEQVHFFIEGYEVPVQSVYTYTTDYKQKAVTAPVTCSAYGEVSLGDGSMKAKMANVRLWNKALPLTEIFGKMDKRLNGSEPGLIAYWPMDEMSGNVLFDKAHGCDLYFKKQTWSMSEGQHSLKLVNTEVKLSNAECFAREKYQDYTLSLWLQPIHVSADSNEPTNVFHSGVRNQPNSLSLLFQDKKFQLHSGTLSYDICDSKEVTDGSWHNVIVVANKSQNASTVYLDGKPRLALDGDALQGMQETAFLGDKKFEGNVDNLTFWYLALPSTHIDMIYNCAPSGSEMGLAYYLPFEMDDANSQNTWQSVFSPYNMVIKHTEDGAKSEPDVAIDVEKLNKDYDNTTSYPAVKTLTGITNIPFAWTSNGNELQINLKQKDADINHQQLFVTVRGVEDLAGNSMANPLMMTVYVDRNVLQWEKSQLEATLEHTQTKTLKTSWQNVSGKNVSYTIENNNSWLDIDNTIGTVPPLGTVPVSITISDALAPGQYSGVVSLVDENNLSSPLTVNVEVLPVEPDWQLTDSRDYQMQMQVIGRVLINTEAGGEYFDIDQRDVVTAFNRNGVCVGRTNLKLNSAKTESHATLNICGSEKMHTSNEEITFCLWRYATNEVYFIKPQDGTRIQFKNNRTYGCPPAEPLTFVTYERKMQSIAVERGWNWISFNVSVGNHTISDLFSTNSNFTIGDYIIYNTGTGADSKLMYSEYKESGWSNTSVTFNADLQTIQLYMHNPAVLWVSGTTYSSDDSYVKVLSVVGEKKTPRWNDLPYLLNVDQPIKVALSDLLNRNLKAGTMVKSRKDFAVADGQNGWVGSLETMRPGMGYYIRSHEEKDYQFKYTNNEIGYTRSESLTRATTDAEIDLILEQGGEHVTTMPVIAQLTTDATWQSEDLLVAYADGEQVGTASLQTLADGRQYFFLSLSAEQGQEVHFAHVRGNEVIGKGTVVLGYDGQGVAGTLQQPLLLSFDGVRNEDAIYDVNGYIYDEAATRHGVYIINGKKQINK